MTFPTVDAALQQPRRPVQIKVEFQDDDGSWVDMSTRFEGNRLMATTGLQASLERETGSFSVQSVTLTVWNGDRFWSWFPPPNPRFNEPAFATYTWKRRRVRISLITLGGTQQIGVWVIDKVRISAKKESATILMRTLTSFLVDAQADRVKNGNQWWRGKASGFLVKRLLETRHTPAEIATFDVADSFQIPTSQWTGDGGITVSSFARPPETDRQYAIYGDPMACNNNAADVGFGDTWVGLEEELWKFNPHTGAWTYWSKLPAALVALGYKIHKVFVSTLRQKVIALAWVPEFPSTDVAADLSGTVGNGIISHSSIVVCVASLTVAPATMTEQFVPAALNYYTGQFTVRSGKQIGGAATQTIIGGHVGAVPDAAQSGVQIPNIAPHWLRSRQPGGVSLYAHDAWNVTPLSGDDATMANKVLTSAYWMQESGRYLNHFDRAAAAPRFPANFRFSIGATRCALAFNEATDEIVMFSITWDPAALRYKAQIDTHNVNTGAGGPGSFTGYYVMSGGEFYLPTSAQFNSNGTKLLITAHRWDESGWTAGAPDETGNDHPMGAIVVEYAWPLTASGIAAGQPTGTLHFYNTNFATTDADNRKRWIPFEAVYSTPSTGAGTRYMALAFLDYTKIGGQCWGACVYQMGSTSHGPVRWSTGRQSGIVLWAGGATEFNWQDAGANVIVWVGGSGLSVIPQIRDQGNAPVEGDVGLSAGLVWNAAMNDGSAAVGGLLGISAPGSSIEGDPDAQLLPANGRFYIYQVAYSMTDRIELADFSELNTFDAISQLAAVGRFVFGYDELGLFFFRQYTVPTVSSGTIKSGPNLFPGDIAASDIDHDFGYEEIFNLAEIAPSRVILRQPTGTVQMLARPVGWVNRPWDGVVSVAQKGLTASHVILRCVEGGLLGNEVAGVIQKNLANSQAVLHSAGAGQFEAACRFDWLVHDVVIETQLLVDWVTSGTNIVIPYAAGVQVFAGRVAASAVSATASAYLGDQCEIGDLITHVRAVSHDLVTGQTTVTLLSSSISAPSPIKAGTRVVFRTNGDNRWSSSEVGIAMIEGAAFTPGAQDSETTFKVTTTRYIQPDTILRIRNAGTPLGYTEHLVLDVLDSQQFIARRLGSGGDAVTIPNVTPVRGYICPIVDPVEFPTGHTFWIGDTGVGVQFAISSKFNLFRGYIETPFMVGDEIDIRADGLVLDQQEMAKVVCVNPESQTKFGLLPYRPGRPSRFLNMRRARERGQFIVTEFGFPHYTESADLPLTTIPRLGALYLVDDAAVLPWGDGLNANGDASPVTPDTATAIGFLVRGFSIDPMQGKLKMDTRAVNPHPY